MSRLNLVTATLVTFGVSLLISAAPLSAQTHARRGAPAAAVKHVPLEADLTAVQADLEEAQLEMDASADAELAYGDIAPAHADLIVHADLVDLPPDGPGIRHARERTHVRFATVPPPPLQQGDSAEALYKLAREHLNQGDYRQAASLFRSLVDRYPNSKYAPDALYWQAFALYRRGGPQQLRRALAVLDEQQERFPKAATRGDADALRVRINGELARGGDSEAAEEVARAAADMADAVAEITVSATHAAAAAVEQARPQIEAASKAAAEHVGPAIDRAMRSASDALRHAGDAIGHFDDDVQLPPECADQQEKIEMRIAALNALLQTESEKAVPILRDVLKRRDVCSTPLRRKAVFLVAQKRTPETENILLDLVRNDPDPGVREQAVFWLSQVPGERSLKAIEEVLTTSTDRKIQERALFALSQHNSPEANATLRRYAADEKAPAELRQRAIFSLGQRHEQRENAEFLERLYKQTADPELKEQILFSLSQMGMQGSDRFLMDVVRDQSQPIRARKQALMQAAQAGRLNTASLAELYDSPIDKELKDPIIFALSQRPDGIEKLMDIARNEKNPGFRKKAIFWLGQSRDPRATKLLQEIVNQ